MEALSYTFRAVIRTVKLDCGKSKKKKIKFNNGKI